MAFSVLGSPLACSFLGQVMLQQEPDSMIKMPILCRLVQEEPQICGGKKYGSRKMNNGRQMWWNMATLTTTALLTERSAVGSAEKDSLAQKPGKSSSTTRAASASTIKITSRPSIRI